MEYIEVCNIRVTNKESHVTYEHRRVPMEHVKMLAAHPNLKVEILSTYRMSREDATTSN